MNAETAEGQSIFGCALQIISTITGGGIVSVPYAMSAPGFEIGIIVNVVIITFMMYCTHLYMSSRDLFGFDSISELSYMSFGRSSVFIINILVAFVIFGILLLYLILFSKISLSLVVPFIGEPPEDGDEDLMARILTNKTTYILLVTAISMPIMLKKNLSELKIQSQILFLGVILLLCVLALMQFQISENISEEGMHELKD